MKIKSFHVIIIVLLVLCIIILGKHAFLNKKPSIPTTSPIKPQKNQSLKESPTTIDIIMRRKSVRHYTDKKISKDILIKIVKAGMAAPTAANKQPWAFIIITKRETLNNLAKNLPYAKMLFKAPAAIVVCGIPKYGLPKKNRENEYWIQDCSAASENILLAVESLNLGAVWTGVYPVEERIIKVRNVLKIPKDTIPLNVIAIGHPQGLEKPKNKYNPQRIHWEEWKNLK